MMGYGSFGQGSSSTLSPLAPPFTVDRSFPKPKPKDPYDFPLTHENWLHLHPPTSISDPISETDSIHVSYGSSNRSTHLFPYDQGSNWSTHLFPYDQGSKSVASSLVESEPYYPQYPSEIHGDSGGSLIASLDGSNQNDCARSLSDFSYSSSKWTSPWSGAFEGEHGKKKEGDVGLSWKDVKGKAVSSNFRNLIEKGGPTAGSFMPSDETSSVWRGKCVESLARKGHIGSKGIGSGCGDAKWSPISEENGSIPSFDMSGTSLFAPSPILPEIPRCPIPDTASLGKPWNPFNLNTTSYDRYFKMLDSCTTDPTVLYPSYSSLAQNFDSPASGAGFSLGPMTKDVDCGYQPVDSSIASANVKEATMNVQGKEGYANTIRIGNGMKRNDHTFVDSSLTKKDNSLNHRPVSGDHSPTEKSKLKITTLSIPNAFTFATGTAGQGDSVQSSSETFDQYNPAVDSPCWKGAPASRHSPFGFEEPVSHLPPIKQLEGWNDLSQQKFTEADKTGADCLSVGNENVTQCSVGIQEPKNDYMLSDNPKNSFEFKTSDTMPLIQEEIIVSSTTIADPGTVSNGSVSNEVAELNGASDISSDCSLPKINAPILVKMIHNLSELLPCGNYSNVNALKEEDYEILQLAIGNLDACVAKKDGLMRAMPESLPAYGSSYSFRKSTDSHKEEKMHSGRSRAKESQSHNFALESGDMDLEKDNGITQAVKKVLTENMRDEGENQPQTLLYKNLWIDSEAALCSMKYELQLVRMKFEMEKCKQNQPQDCHTLSDAAGKSINVEKFDVKDIGGTITDEMSAPEAEERSTENIPAPGDDVTQSGVKYQTEDVEASVMARFRVLKSRIDSLSSTNKVEQQVPDSVDVGINVGMHETKSIPCLETKLDVGTKNEPINVFDLGFGEGTRPWPFIRDVMEDDNLGVRSNLRHIGANSTHEIGLGSDVSEQLEMTREFHVGIEDESMMQSHIADWLGNQVPSVESDSPSSDWEHVLKEELSW
ncbi:uncharacterized protein LOC143887955 [Tasmannia lanceolata]|uniref:uncharacterized protein LOC143887955 n=1 Tax=Tasmannia lanceolata TaxID=3420 RepID=UPI004063783B